MGFPRWLQMTPCIWRALKKPKTMPNAALLGREPVGWLETWRPNAASLFCTPLPKPAPRFGCSHATGARFAWSVFRSKPDLVKEGDIVVLTPEQILDWAEFRTEGDVPIKGGFTDRCGRMLEKHAGRNDVKKRAAQGSFRDTAASPQIHLRQRRSNAPDHADGGDDLAKFRPHPN